MTLIRTICSLALAIYFLLIAHACWMKPQAGCLELNHKMYLLDSFEYKGRVFFIRECRSQDKRDTFPNYSYAKRTY